MIKQQRGNAVIASFIIVLVIALLVGAFVVVRGHTQKPAATTVASCTTQQLSVGSSGSCVRDIQTMVNFLETDSLTECPFSGAQTLPINGTYDGNTEAQVKIVQTWVNCYNHEEGTAPGATPNGIVGSSTWSELCTLAYQYPKQSNNSASPFFKASLAAGQNAGCE